MSDYLDFETWPRRALFEFFKNFDKPFFNVCTNLDATGLTDYLTSRPEISVMLAYHYFALRAANAVEPFRYRIEGGKVRIYEVVHGGTTVLLPNECFAFAQFQYSEDFRTFHANARRIVQEVKTGGGELIPGSGNDLIHCTTLPWYSFTSFSHARNYGREDSVPKLAFGKFLRENNRVLMPISVEVHHALMDGIHVGRFLDHVRESLAHPEKILA